MNRPGCNTAKGARPDDRTELAGACILAVAAIYTARAQLARCALTTDWPPLGMADAANPLDAARDLLDAEHAPKMDPVDFSHDKPLPKDDSEAQLDELLAGKSEQAAPITPDVKPQETLAPRLGWVDFVWGSPGGEPASGGQSMKGKGIAHLIGERIRKDGLTPSDSERVAQHMVDVIGKGTEVARAEIDGNVNVRIDHDGYQAVLVRRKGANSWLLTGFKKMTPDDTGAIGHAPAPTHERPTGNRPNVGAGADDIVPPNDLQDNQVQGPSSGDQSERELVNDRSEAAQDSAQGADAAQRRVHHQGQRGCGPAGHRPRRAGRRGHTMTPHDAPKLTGNRCRCSACGESFNGLAGFDAHRIGAHGVNRRCLTVAEMLACGYVKNAARFWVTDSRAQRAARQSAAGISGARGTDPMPCPSADADARTAAVNAASRG